MNTREECLKLCLEKLNFEQTKAWLDIFKTYIKKMFNIQEFVHEFPFNEFFNGDLDLGLFENSDVDSIMNSVNVQILNSKYSPPELLPFCKIIEGMFYSKLAEHLLSLYSNRDDSLSDTDMLEYSTTNDAVKLEENKDSQPEPIDADGDRSNNCEICGQTYASYYVKISHLQNVHQKPSEFQCSKCNNYFTSDSNLEVHRRKFC